MKPRFYIWSCCEVGASTHLLNGAYIGDVEQVQHALDTEPLLVLHKGRAGLKDTAFHLAAAQGHADVLRALLNHVHSNIQLLSTELAQRTNDPVPWSRDQTVRHIINTLNIKGQTPLMFACFAGRTECVELIIRSGGDPWVHDFCGRRTALHYAALHGQVSCIEAVLDLMNPQDLVRIPPRRRRLRPTHMLVNQVTMSGFTPLHFAAYSRKPGTMTSLLERGANPVALTVTDQAHDIIMCPRWTTPLHVIAYNGFEEGAVELLRHYLASRESGQFRDPRRTADRASRLPYHVAALHGYSRLSDMLRPSYSLSNIFPDGEVLQRGVPKLSVLCAKVVQQALLAQVDSADAKIAQMEQSPTTLLPELSKVSKVSTAKTSTAHLPAAQPGLAGHQSRQQSQPGTPAMAVAPATCTLSPANTTTSTGLSFSRSASHLRSPAPTLLQRISRSVLSRASASIEPTGGTHVRTGSANPPTRAGVSSNGARGVSISGYVNPLAEVGGLRESGELSTEWGARRSAPIWAGTRPQSMHTPDWWAPDLVAQGHVDVVVGAPVPNDRTAEAALSRGQSMSLLDRVRSLGAGRHKEPPACMPCRTVADSDLSSMTGGEEGVQGSAASSHCVAAPSMRKCLSSSGQAAAAMAADTEISPFTQISWGTSAMVASLPAVETCSVCLDDVQSLVLVPCLHRLCVPCTRQLIMAMQQKPLNCPVCRGTVKACFAPRDVEALEAALELYPTA